MNPIDLISSAFRMLLEGTIAASILAAVIWLAQRALGRRLDAAWRYALWLPFLLRLLLPVFPESSISIFNAPRWLNLGAPSKPRVQVQLLDEVHVPRSLSNEPVSIPLEVSHLDSEQIPTSTALSAFEVASLAWFSISVLLLLRLAAGSCWLRFRLVQTAAPVDPRLVHILSQTRSQMRTSWNPRLLETSCIGSPGLFGCFRPRLLLPRALPDQLTETELRHVFLHELAHLKRGDLWLNALMAIAQALHWFNPITWFVFRHMRLERELACDVLAMRATGAGETHAYGETILKLLERIASPSRFPAVVGILEEKQAARSRLIQIARFSASGAKPWKLGLASLAFLSIVGLSNAQPDSREIPAAVVTSKNEKPLVISEKTDLPGSKPTSLQAEYQKQKQRVDNAQKVVDDLRESLKISDIEKDLYADQNTKENALIAQTERLTSLIKLNDDLKEKSRADLRKILPTVAPDAAMDRYLRDLALVEQQYVATIDDLGSDHPEITKLKTLTKKINEQIEERIDGVLAGLELQLGQAQRIYREQKDALIAYMQDRDRYSPYFAAKRHLENEQRTLDKLSAQLLAEKVDVPPASNKINVAILVQDARLLMEMGKLDEAQKKLTQALDIDPDHRAARYYLAQIQPRRQQMAQSRTNRAYFSTGRAAIARKLDGIVLEKYEVPGDLELSEVVKDLYRIARERDVDKHGVNFIISSFLDKGPLAPVPGQAVDPLTGQPPVTETPLKVEDYKVTIAPPLINVRLMDVLDAITRVAKPPAGANQNIGVKYSIEDYAVVFSLRVPEAEPLYTRTYKVNPNFFISGVEAVTGRTIGGSALQDGIRDFFVQAGIDFETNSPAAAHRKAFFFNPEKGILMVRATLADLDIVETSLQALNIAPTQVVIETQVVLLNRDATHELDLALRLIATNQAPVATISGILTDPQFKAIIDVLEKRARPQADGEHNEAPSDKGFASTGILTEPQFRSVLRSLEKRAGVDLLACPKVTTLSRRRARVSIEGGPAVDLLPIIESNGMSIRLSVEAEIPSPEGADQPASKAKASATLFDGQTFVIRPADVAGRPAMIFVTPIIIDPAGNRVHSPDNLPYDPNRIPEQKP